MENVLVIFLGFLASTQALIVPQELPSLLSLVYSNIPPVKKGTDSRVGLGFRLGNHADFQLLFELGPQKDTKPLGSIDGDSSNAKRNVNQEDYNEFIHEKPRVPEKINSEPGDWLKNWSKDIRKKKIHNKVNANPQTQAIYTRPIVRDDVLKQLSVLYQHANTEDPNQNLTSTEPPESPSQS